MADTEETNSRNSIDFTELLRLVCSGEKLCVGTPATGALFFIQVSPVLESMADNLKTPQLLVAASHLQYSPEHSLVPELAKTPHKGSIHETECDDIDIKTNVSLASQLDDAGIVRTHSTRSQARSSKVNDRKLKNSRSRPVRNSGFIGYRNVQSFMMKNCDLKYMQVIFQEFCLDFKSFCLDNSDENPQMDESSNVNRQLLLLEAAIEHIISFHLYERKSLNELVDYLDESLNNSVQQYAFAQNRFYGDISFDVFLSYNSKDASFVNDVFSELQCRGISPWCDVVHLRPGTLWPKEFEKQCSTVKSVAIFLGSNELGPHQEDELNAFLCESKERGLRIIPVLLPNCVEELNIPKSISSRIRVDFRTQTTDLKHSSQMDSLVSGITDLIPW